MAAGRAGLLQRAQAAGQLLWQADFDLGHVGVGAGLLSGWVSLTLRLARRIQPGPLAARIAVMSSCRTQFAHFIAIAGHACQHV